MVFLIFTENVFKMSLGTHKKVLSNNCVDSICKVGIPTTIPRGHAPAST